MACREEVQLGPEDITDRMTPKEERLVPAMDRIPGIAVQCLVGLAVVGMAVITVPTLGSQAVDGLSEEEIAERFIGGDLKARLEWIWRIPKMRRKIPRRADRLIDLGIDDPDEIVRQNVLLVLESLRDPDYLTQVDRALEDEKESVRWFARYAKGAIATKDRPDSAGVSKAGKGSLECRYDGMIGYYGPHTPDDEWGWKFMEEFKRLGYGYAFGNPGTMVDLWCPNKPSWRGGRVVIPSSFWKAMERYEEMGIDFYFVFEFKSKSGYRTVKGKELGHKVEPAGWQSHFYEEGLDREIRTTWDPSAPPGWTLLDEFRLHVRNIMRANKEHGDMIDGWLFFSEPSRPNYFGDNYENPALLIQAGMEEAKKISPEAYLGFHGILRPRLERLRQLYARGATDIYAAAYRMNLNQMPEALYLQDDVDRGGGWLETMNSFHNQAKKWGIVDPRDGRTKVVQMERILNVIGEHRGPTFGPRTFMADTPLQREKHADYWARSVLLALSTGYVCKLSAVYHNNPFWSWGSPSGIGIQYDIPQVKRLREQDIAAGFERGRIPPKPKSMSNRSAVMRRTFFEIFTERGRDGLYRAIDGYLAGRRPDLRKPSYFASMILRQLLGHAIFIGRMDLEEPDFGLRFRDEGTGRMITALWRASRDGREIEVKTDEGEVRVFRREGNLGIRESVVTPDKGRIRLEIDGNPVYVVGEIRDVERVTVSLLDRSRSIEREERGIVEIDYVASRDLSGGSLDIEIPEGWIAPQTSSPEVEGYITAEAGPGVVLGEVRARGGEIEVPIERMPNGHTLRLLYGDARKDSYLYDMGEDQFGPISPDHLKIQGNMVYYESAGDGFDHEGLPRARGDFWSRWPSAGGCGIPDNDPHSIYRDMAVSATYDGWTFSVDVEPEPRYQVKIFLNGKGTIDDQLSSQRVVIGDRSFDSTRDRIVRGVSPGENGRITVQFYPDEDGNSMNRYFEGNPREDVIYQNRRKIRDNTPICYLYGLEIIPEHLGAGPTEEASVGPNTFHFRAVSPDGTVTRLEADMNVTAGEIR